MAGRRQGRPSDRIVATPDIRDHLAPGRGETTLTEKKQYRRGLAQLDEEGVVQVLRDPSGGDADAILVAVGQLQFEVFAHRLASEFGAPTELSASPYHAIRSTDHATAERLRDIGGVRIMRRDTDELVALFENPYRLQRLQHDHPDLVLLPLVTTTE